MAETDEILWMGLGDDASAILIPDILAETIAEEEIVFIDADAGDDWDDSDDGDVFSFDDAVLTAEPLPGAEERSDAADSAPAPIFMRGDSAFSDSFEESSTGTFFEPASSVAPAAFAPTPISAAATIRGSRADDMITPSPDSDVIRTHKGDDTVDAGAGDDFIMGGHGDDVLDGGTGNDVLSAGKGDDTLVYTLGENVGNHDRYDGGKGFDTLELRLTVEEFNALREELIELDDWMAQHVDVKASSGVKFNDESARGADKHDIFETSFGLDLRYIETLKVVVDGHGEVSLDAPLGDPAPEPDLPTAEPDPSTPEPELPAPDPSADVVTVDVAEAVAGDVPVSMTLAAGSTTTVSINVEVKELPPIYDVYMVQDLSGSFYNDLPNVKSLLPTLMENLGAENDVAFGVGSFVDKPYETFGSAGYDYVYKTEQAVSTDFTAVQEAMDALRTYSGYDYPESQLEALVQTALRSAEIGFREGSQRYVVLSTDAAFHQEGDFDTHTDKSGKIVDVVDNDYDTDLELEDYPEMTAVGAMLEAAGITPIFAVTATVMPTYQALVDSWGFGSVVELDSDSANIVEAITTGITTTSVDLTLDVTGDDYGYVTAMTPEVYPDAGPGMYSFDITLEIPEDTSGLGSDGLSVSIPGYGTIDLDIAIAGMDLTGDGTANTLVGDDGNNIIDGLGGDDTLTGGLGNDTFVFADGSGGDRITDFKSGDLLDLRRLTAVTTAADVIAAASQVGADTVIDFDTGDSIILEGVKASSLTEEDVLI